MKSVKNNYSRHRDIILQFINGVLIEHEFRKLRESNSFGKLPIKSLAHDPRFIFPLSPFMRRYSANIRYFAVLVHLQIYSALEARTRSLLHHGYLVDAESLENFRTKIRLALERGTGDE